MTETPCRNVGETIPCPICAQPFAPLGRQRVCSAACRQALWRRRHSVTREACPSCETHYLGLQRCPDCGVFCRRVGPGGLCPHCDEPVAFADLSGALS